MAVHHAMAGSCTKSLTNTKVFSSNNSKPFFQSIILLQLHIALLVLEKTGQCKPLMVIEAVKLQVSKTGHKAILAFGIIMGDFHFSAKL